MAKKTGAELDRDVENFLGQSTAGRSTMLTDDELSGQMIALMNCDNCWRSTDELLYTVAGRATREQILRVLFALHDAGAVSYRRNLGWRRKAR